MNKTTLVAIEMGYGHLRPAHALAERLDTPVLEVDRPPLADATERALWSRARGIYEFGSRLSQLPVVGGPLRQALDSLTSIEPLHPFRDLSAPTAGTRTLERMRMRGMGRGLVEHLGRTNSPLLTTFFAPAVIADRAGCEPVYCVVTDSDINRVWAPIDAARSRIRYFAPSLRVERRLRAYGVPAEHIEYTGYPLPHELLGGIDLPVLKQNLAARLVRLDPEGRFRQAYRDELHHFLGELPAPGEIEKRPPRLTFAIGGAGAQARLARDFLPGFRGLIESQRFRVSLVAGVRKEVADDFRSSVAAAGLEPHLGRGLDILIEEEMPAYFRRFNELLTTTDILWTKPSEITFFAALGLPLVFSWPMGVHERYNRRWAMHAGAGLKQSEPRFAADWIGEWLSDGTLAAAAWSGYMRLPKFGLYRIVETLQNAQNK
jgi:hypothetical protein